MKKYLKSFLWNYFPTLFSHYSAFRNRNSEPEIALISYLCEKSRVSVDIGAYRGTYSYYMMKYSSFCYAFEPNPVESKFLENRFNNCKEKIGIKNVALSDKSGKTNLRIPHNDNGRSTIETDNELDGYEINKLEIDMKRLDDYKLEDIEFIKIDVEGHEEAVLNGSKDTIRRNQPSFIIEIEERHKIGSIEKVFTFFRKLDYKGFFFIDNKLVSIDEFERDKYQNKKNVAGSRAIGVYLNNFVFLHSKKLFRINSLIK